MAIVEYQQPCSLCGQPVLVSSFTLTTPDELKKFCCAGCLSIYKLLNEYSLTPSIKLTSQKK
jgi:hypothetical protein